MYTFIFFKVFQVFEKLRNEGNDVLKLTSVPHLSTVVPTFLTKSPPHTKKTGTPRKP